MKLGLAFLKEKEKLAAASASVPFELQWEAGDTGVCELRYAAIQAGTCALHVWCEPGTTVAGYESQGERVPLPGSPFTLTVGTGKAAAAVSLVDGYTKLIKEEKTSMSNKARAACRLPRACPTAACGRAEETALA